MDGFFFVHPIPHQAGLQPTKEALHGVGPRALMLAEDSQQPKVEVPIMDSHGTSLVYLTYMK